MCMQNCNEKISCHSEKTQNEKDANYYAVYFFTGLQRCHTLSFSFIANFA